MMKKVIMLIAIAILFALPGCGNSTAPNNNASIELNEPAKVKSADTLNTTTSSAQEEKQPEDSSTQSTENIPQQSQEPFSGAWIEAELDETCLLIIELDGTCEYIDLGSSVSDDGYIQGTDLFFDHRGTITNISTSEIGRTFDIDLICQENNERFQSTLQFQELSSNQVMIYSLGQEMGVLNRNGALFHAAEKSSGVYHIVDPDWEGLPARPEASYGASTPLSSSERNDDTHLSVESPAMSDSELHSVLMNGNWERLDGVYDSAGKEVNAQQIFGSMIRYGASILFNQDGTYYCSIAARDFIGTWKAENGYLSMLTCESDMDEESLMSMEYVKKEAEPMIAVEISAYNDISEKTTYTVIIKQSN